MEMKRVVARFMVHKVGSFVLKERVLCLGEYSFWTLDRENQHVTNTWPYEDVDGANVLEGETDLVIHTPRHRIKKTVFRCHFRMEVLVCLMRLRSQHYAKAPDARQPPPLELQTHAFQSLKCHRGGVQSTCVVEVRPDGIYQKDTEGDLMSHIPYTSLVSIDLICDDHEAIALNHSDNSSLFIVPRRTELAQAIDRVMKAYGMQINEYRKKTIEAALKDDGKDSSTTSVSFEYQVLKVSQSNESSAAPRTLSVSEKYITEYVDATTVISSRPLSRIYSLIMYQDTLQAFEVVYVDGIKRKYYSAQREKIVCELLASCHALGNYQVGVEVMEVPDWVRMIPRKIILQEGNKIANIVPNVNVLDRELRVAQATILQLMSVHGHRKTERFQRQLPRGLDEEMHSLAAELNANTPTSGVIAQPNKPFERVLYVLARELNDIVKRHGANQDFVITYLQSLYRLMLAPPAINEFMQILTEHREEYMIMISKILVSKNSVAIYWMFMVLSRLMESKAHKLPCRQLLLSNSLFVMTLLSLLDEDTHTRSFLSDLPTMKLCQFILLLVKANIEKQRKLRTGRHGSTHLRKKKLCFVHGTIQELTDCSKKTYDLKNLRRVVIPGLDSTDAQAMVALEFSDCSRVVYVPYDVEKFLAALYDGYRYVDNFNVSLSREFPNLNPRMSPRALLKDEQENFLYLNHDGLYIPAHVLLEKEIETMGGEGVSITSATNRITFALESLNMNVETNDFAGKSMRGRLEKLSFGSLLRGVNNLLEHSCKPPIRANEVCIILETFCRINDGCYRFTMEQSNGGAMTIVPTLAQVLVSGDPIATVWAVNALHSLVADKSRSNSHRAAEKDIRFQVFEYNKLISLLTGLLEQRNPSSTLVMLQLMLDVLVVSRHSTDNNHFDALD
ncbi:DnaJ-like protein subfamily C member 13 [Phytophthora ramorum]|uniref:DnaJ-like protein subfamily C member 13 n=1 Tax=Phytophthora ramorum TaxID=164328 RepID=UPI0030975CA2|nr:DnaJ-like protein subfamily C member 13 [Phytophthora ramorum]